MAKKQSVYKLSDESISQLVKLLQLGILTGTDVVDNYRLLEFVVVDGKLEPSPEYLTAFDENLQKLEAEAVSLSANQQPGFKVAN